MNSMIDFFWGLVPWFVPGHILFLSSIVIPLNECVYFPVFSFYNDTSCFGFSSVQFRHSVMSNSLWPQGLQHGRLRRASPAPGAYSNSCPLSQWCHSAISSSVVPFSSCPQSLRASGSFPMSQFFPSGGQSIGVSALTSVHPMNPEDWSPLGWTSWISLQSKGLSRVFSNTTVQKHQFFCTQLSLYTTLTSIHDYWINHSLD